MSAAIWIPKGGSILRFYSTRLVTETGKFRFSIDKLSSWPIRSRNFLVTLIGRVLKGLSIDLCLCNTYTYTYIYYAYVYTYAHYVRWHIASWSNLIALSCCHDRTWSVDLDNRLEKKHQRSDVQLSERLASLGIAYGPNWGLHWNITTLRYRGVWGGPSIAPPLCRETLASRDSKDEFSLPDLVCLMLLLNSPPILSRITVFTHKFIHGGSNRPFIFYISLVTGEKSLDKSPPVKG